MTQTSSKSPITQNYVFQENQRVCSTVEVEYLFSRSLHFARLGSSISGFRANEFNLSGSKGNGLQSNLLAICLSGPDRWIGNKPAYQFAGTAREVFSRRDDVRRNRDGPFGIAPFFESPSLSKPLHICENTE